MTVSLQNVEQSIGELRQAIKGRGWPERGGLAQSFTRPTDVIAQYVKERKAMLGKKLDKATLRDGLLIMRALDDHQLDGEIEQLETPTTERRFAVVLTLAPDAASNPRLEGGAAQLVQLLTIIGGSVNSTIPRTAPAPETPPAE